MFSAVLSRFISIAQLPSLSLLLTEGDGGVMGATLEATYLREQKFFIQNFGTTFDKWHVM